MTMKERKRLQLKAMMNEEYKTEIETAIELQELTTIEEVEEVIYKKLYERFEELQNASDDFTSDLLDIMLDELEDFTPDYAKEFESQVSEMYEQLTN